MREVCDGGGSILFVLIMFVNIITKIDHQNTNLESLKSCLKTEKQQEKS